MIRRDNLAREIPAVVWQLREPGRGPNNEVPEREEESEDGLIAVSDDAATVVRVYCVRLSDEHVSTMLVCLPRPEDVVEAAEMFEGLQKNMCLMCPACATS